MSTMEDMRNQLESIRQAREELEEENELLGARYARLVEDVGEERYHGGKEGEGKGRMLTAEEKFEIANAEVLVVQETVEAERKRWQDKQEELKAKVEEAESRVKEARHETQEFKRDVVSAGEDPATGKPTAERVWRYYQRLLSEKSTRAEKLRNKLSNLKSKIRKQEHHSQQKEEEAEAPQTVDYEQMKIENQQALERIEERNSQLLKFKLTVGKSVQSLNQRKKKLSRLSHKNEWLRSEADRRRNDIAKFENDISRLSRQKDQLRRRLHLVKQENDDPDKPRVMEYVRIKQERQDLERQVNPLSLPSVSILPLVRWRLLQFTPLDLLCCFSTLIQVAELQRKHDMLSASASRKVEHR